MGDLHPVSMLITYYLLIGGLVNELFVRVPVIRALSLAGRTGNPAQTPLAGMVQGGTMTVFIALLAWFIVRVASCRRRTAVAAIAS